MRFLVILPHGMFELECSINLNPQIKSRLVGLGIQWSLNLTECQGAREISSLYRGSVPYILKGQLEKIVRYTEDLLIKKFVKSRFH